MELILVIGLLVAYAFLARAIAGVAYSKGRSFAAWYYISFFFMPLAAIIVASLAPLPETELASPSRGVRTCPYCAEEVQVKAIKCKHCGEDISEGN